jgi:hypothetical protein
VRGFAPRLWLGWLAVGLALLLVPATQARVAAVQSGGARLGLLDSGLGLAQSAQSGRQALTGGKAIRIAVRDAFVALNAVNKKLYARKWGQCRKASKALRRTARNRRSVLLRLTPETKTVRRGLSAAITSLQYWDTTGLDAVDADAAAKVKNQSRFNHWYGLYKKHYELGLKYQNLAVRILSKD